jgi:SAM-dependent methyltransferase
VFNDGFSRFVDLVPFTNSSRHYLAQLNQAVAAEIPAGANVLDAGAGHCPYKPFLSHTNYESTDVQQRGDITYVCDICSIPVNDGRYDFILFNQCRRALPKAALRELARVLKKGGRILYTGPLFYEEHEQPYDFYRYTQFALRYLFAEAGFQIERLRWLEGYAGTVAYQLRGAALNLPLSPKHYGGGVAGFASVPILLIAKVAFTFLSALLCRLDMRHRFTDAGYPKNYYVIAGKT